jgi:flagellar assembly protein FliH
MLCEDSKRLRAVDVQSFRYAPIGPFGGAEALPFSSTQNGKARDTALEEKLATAVATARTKGFQEAQAGAQQAAAEIIEGERAAVTAAVQEFSSQRTEYFRKVEVEAVRLALSIARKVLHREAQMDPLLLAGVVRVALDQMQAGTRVVLHTSPDTARNWAEFCSAHFEQSHAIEVVPDAKLKGHSCFLEADIGSTEISVESQLQEIESGFFDRLEEVAPSTP